MLVILRCKHCGTSFSINFNNFYNDDIECRNCRTTLYRPHKQRLFDITDNLETLARLIDNFDIVGLTNNQDKNRMSEDLIHLQSLHRNADKNSKVLIEHIIDDVYTLCLSPLICGDLKELANIYESIHSLSLSSTQQDELK